MLGDSSNIKFLLIINDYINSWLEKTQIFLKTCEESLANFDTGEAWMGDKLATLHENCSNINYKLNWKGDHYNSTHVPFMYSKL